MENKQPKSELAQYISATIPMVEELAEGGLIPMAVIGVRLVDVETGKFEMKIATINDSDITHNMIKGMLRDFVKCLDEGTVKQYVDGKETENTGGG